MKPMIGISSCLLGFKVRWDGNILNRSSLLGPIEDHFTLMGHCPEIEMGLPSPRPPIHLYQDQKGQLGVRETGSQKDLSLKAKEATARLLPQVGHLSGFIFAKNSPSCGSEKIKVYGEDKVLHRQGQGFFYSSFKEKFPFVPTIDEGRLHDPLLREKFFAHVYFYHRLNFECHDISHLIELQAEYKYFLMSLSPLIAKDMGRLLASYKDDNFEDIKYNYLLLSTKIFEEPIKHSKRENVLLHILGHFKKDLTSAEKSHVIEEIKSFKLGLQDFEVPLNLLHFLAKKYAEPYLSKQKIFALFPSELKRKVS